MLKWYLDHGLKVTKIYEVIEFRENACFKEFVAEVTKARREGDERPECSILAETFKLLGNSAFSSLIRNLLKDLHIKYCHGDNEACKYVNDSQFRDLTCLDPEQQVYEIEMAKRRITFNMPIQLGFFILQYSKLRMIDFYYSFMLKYVDRSDFEYIEMDTDSAYMALSGKKREDVIKPSMKDQYMKGFTGLCTDDKSELERTERWFPRTCCERHAKYDKREPGLFKTEYEGDEMIGLCSKTYIVAKKVNDRTVSTGATAQRLVRKAKGLKPKQSLVKSIKKIEMKFSSKGISQRFVREPLKIFRQVLKQKKTAVWFKQRLPSSQQPSVFL